MNQYTIEFTFQAGETRATAQKKISAPDQDQAKAKVVRFLLSEGLITCSNQVKKIEVQGEE